MKRFKVFLIAMVAFFALTAMTATDVIDFFTVKFGKELGRQCSKAYEPNPIDGKTYHLGYMNALRVLKKNYENLYRRNCIRCSM